MVNSQTFDVIVVGGGPGGAVAAKRCAEAGLMTVLIEKKKLPRDKVCTGMVMGDWAHDIIRLEFGEIPEAVLVDPPCLTGHRLHVAGAETQTLEWPTPFTWRRNLDFWMLLRAKEAGVAIREDSRVVSVTPEQGLTRVTTQHHGLTEELRARFVIGADGSTSVVRKSLFRLKVRYSSPIRECYRGKLDLQRNVIHWFFPKGRPRPRFNVNHKDDVFLIEGSGIKELRREINETLMQYGFDPRSKPEWKDGCAIAMLHEQLLSKAFVPAQGNNLLVGDAAGLIFPITFEGIGSALKSGVAAADAVSKSVETGKHAAAFYLEALELILEKIRHLCSVQNELGDSSMGDPHRLAASMLSAYRETLIIQENSFVNPD
ncbi:MAG: FAD-dependent monooxygenase [Desulfomonile tiedjei]|uniref:FAD-dependent monooxygenase n=1 Tax=Desulfomonile tiedjei TaxID=2358 RepID=A0A9D6Z3X2_9BACT|nr:FAD-dependent monooxygenase [Desulfomonile tiedjei]